MRGRWLDGLERWRQYRSIVEHEDELIHQRVTWLFSSQAMLLAAYALVFTEMIKAPLEFRRSLAILAILIVICGVGLAVAISVWVWVNAAVRHLGKVKEDWRNEHFDWSCHPPLAGEFNQWYHRVTRFELIPIVFVVGWAFLAVAASEFSVDCFGLVKSLESTSSISGVH